MRAPVLAAAVLLALLGGGVPRLAAQALPQDYATRAAQPDARDFVSRQGGDLVVAEQTLRFGGANVSWLGIRSDKGDGSDARFPDEFEVRSLFDSASMMGISVIRARGLLGSAGCALCVLPEPGKPENETVLRAADHVVKLAHDHGIKLILPLAGTAGDCAKPADRARGGDICAYVRAHGKTDAASFFTDPAIIADFSAHVSALLGRVNLETGLAWRDDPAILAFETCNSCAGDAPPGAVGRWSAQIAALVHAQDKLHLVMSGALSERAGRFGSGPPVASADIAPPGIDIVGISPDTAHLQDALDAAMADGHPVIIENLPWSPAAFTKLADLEDYLARLRKRRALNGALISEFSGLSANGGYLADSDPARPALFYPGTTTKAADAAEMQTRARALRRFAFGMSGFYVTPMFATPDAPLILSVTAGHVRWRGAAGADSYSIWRVANAKQAQPNWQLACDRCAGGAQSDWQDPAPLAGTSWYRVTPFDPNGHAGVHSDPVLNK